MAKRKTSTIASKSNSTQKEPRYFDTYFDLFGLRQKPVTDAFIDRLIEKILIWARDKKSMKISSFFYEQGIPMRTINRWSDKHQNLKDVIEDVKYMIGDRRELGAIYRKFEPGMIRTAMHLYDPEWKDMEIWRSELKAKQDEKIEDKKITWLLNKFPDSKLVPEKKKDE